MFGFIGVGQAGGSVADEAMKRGFHSVAINYSLSDLNSLVNVQDKLHLVGTEGVGKDRSIATKHMKNNWESSIEFIKNTMEKPSVQVIFVVFSAAGGTGSGVAPILLEFLNECLTHKTIVAVPILPDNNEVLVNQMNSLELLGDLSMPETCVLPLDNQMVLSKYEGKISESRLYKETNKMFLDLVEVLLNYTDRGSKISTLDRKDLNQLFDTPGIMTIAQTDLTEFTNGGKYFDKLHEDIQKSWNNSIFTPVEFENVMRAGVILDVHEFLTEHISYNELFNVFDNKMPLDLFKGHYDKGSRAITILSGLTWINERMKQLDELIEKGNTEIKEATVYKAKNRRREDLFKPRKLENKESKKTSYMDALKKLKR
ncbi:cell division protein FtsZ [Bacillus amyloliquefaciens]|uniref:cell division protein FtsZ n=1 Tax=Bacillus amyloliquefaciens TaxID=1390 RepID=UPI000E27C124|nr:cell division protein FtsZ [Bacillus amyloliquefaciens]RDY88605.1 cell division protein FtsZ [Bacillus amyloliquefaciens]